jgi:molybdopterin molybdotransferase
MFNVKSVEETFQILQEAFGSYVLGQETVDIREAPGRITACAIRSGEDIPGFHRSSVDGYAVIAADTFGAGEAIPAQLVLTEEVRMGAAPAFTLQKGFAAYVPTGGEIPQGADAVVMIEYTENFQDGFIYINKSAAPGSNIVLKGDDIKEGHLILGAGRCLKPQDIGALAALGFERVDVIRKIRVGVVSTGDEVIPISEKPSGAKVRDVNSFALHSGILALGGEPKQYGIIEDSFDKIRDTVEKALQECDIVLISGGSSVGTKDETCRVIQSLGSPGVLVHGIAVKPGKPTIIGKIADKAVIGLPGHPASAYFIFRIFVGHLMHILTRTIKPASDSIKAELATNYPSNHGREEYLPVRLERTESRTTAHPLFGKSGLITLLTSADGYVRIPRSAEGLAAGQDVDVIMF